MKLSEKIAVGIFREDNAVNARLRHTFLRTCSVIKICLIIALYVALTCFVWIVFLRESGVNRNVHARLAEMVDWTADKPYVYRTLLPTTVHVISMVTPGRLTNAIETKLSSTETIQAFSQYALVEPGFLYENILVFGLMYLSLIGYAVMLFKLARMVLGEKSVLAHLAPCIGMLSLPPFFVFGYIYDFPVLFLCSICIYLLFQQKWFGYFFFFALSCLNKETTIVLFVAYLAYFYDKLDIKQFSLLAFIHLAVFGLIKGGLHLAFANNPGVVMYVTIAAQFKHFIFMYSYINLFLLLIMIFLLVYDWKNKPEFLKRSLWMAAPLIVLFMIGGCPGEYRVFYEILPILVLLVTHTLIHAGKFAVAKF